MLTILHWFIKLQLTDTLTSGASIQNNLPYSLQGIKDTFSGSGPNTWVIGTSIAAIILLSLVAAWQFQSIKSRRVHNQENPYTLFKQLLDHLELSAADKKLLRRMAHQGRLRHPAMCLLSPGLLHWASTLWQKEKGPNTITPKIQNQLNHIAIKLYDHHA
ncbi:MAG: hypothetical protein JW860_03605 [Sedimentisphaerales bacterium]|nr:hypothetical protein [Sedimentisphaerales bacterium]